MRSFTRPKELHVGTLYRLRLDHDTTHLPMFDVPTPPSRGSPPGVTGSLMNNDVFVVVEFDGPETTAGEETTWVKVCSKRGMGWALFWKDLKDFGLTK